MKSYRAVSLLDVLVIVAAICLVFSLIAPGLATIKGESKRQRCATNLRRLGMACYIYAQDDPGIFPAIAKVRGTNDGKMVIFDKANRSRKPDSDALPSPTVDLWALLRQRNVTPKAFICPATKDVPDPASDPSAYYDFASAKNLSYAYQFQHDPNRALIGTSSAPAFPFMADGNPYIKDKVKTDILEDRISKYKGNSKNHGKKRKGQNVLFQDGHTAWEKAPDAGMAGSIDKRIKDGRGRDNIYTTHVLNIKGSNVDPGSAAPTRKSCNLGSRSDASLVP